MTSEELLQIIEQAAVEGATALSLHGNQLSTLPIEIGNLTSLKLLSLHGNQLSTLPIEIGNLTSLQSLDLNGNQLSTLPAEIGNLTSLQLLDLGGNQLSTLPAEIGNLTSLQSLNLRNNQLSTLPTEIGNLTSLKSLNLRSNQLNTLPTEIGNLTSLKSLHLSGNQLSMLPIEIGNLASLQTLDLNRNQLSMLPIEIGNLASLQTLDLNRNQLSTLPAEIGNLASLQTLDLRRNQLSTLPAEIGNLTNLRSLNLGGNQLSTLPAEIGNLTSLRSLDLWGNQLSTLPAEIVNLTSLRSLDLSDNQLSTLPAEIINLTRLQSLSLGDNQLSTLPAEIVNLTSLQSLNLSGNQLSTLPAEIVNLTSLESLDLSDNQLSTLPAEIANLTSLQSLDLRRNHLGDISQAVLGLPDLETIDLRQNKLPIPPEILGSNTEHSVPDALKRLVSYYQSLQSGEAKRLNEAKLLLVGQGSMGKTSLVRRLIGDDFNPHQDKTEGIDIKTWNMTVRGEEVRINIWDFGGQEIMHHTHQFFLTERSLYLLVLDARVDEEANRLEYWLKIIETFGNNSPVIIVGNKIDQQRLDINQGGLRKKYPNIRAIVETSCKTAHGIEQLQAEIIDAIAELDPVFYLFSMSWLTVKQQLEALQEDYITFEKYLEICHAAGVEDEASQATLLAFLNDLGIALNFRDDPRLEDTNILNPEWVTNGVYAIINDKTTIPDNKGILLRSHLCKILDSTRYRRPKQQMFVIDMMCKFKLCFALEGESTSQYLIPGLLPKEQPTIDESAWADALVFQYHYKVLPASIIAKFIVQTHANVYERVWWRNGILLAHQNNQALIESDPDPASSKISIRVNGDQRNRRRFLYSLRLLFNAIHQTFAGLDPEEKVPIPGHPKVLVDYEHLLRLEKRGTRTFFPPGLPDDAKDVDVRELLDGIRSEEEKLNRSLGQPIELSASESSNLTLNMIMQTVQNQSQRQSGDREFNTIHQHGLGDNIGSDKVMGNKSGKSGS